MTKARDRRIPAVRVSIGEEFGMPAGTPVTEVGHGAQGLMFETCLTRTLPWT